MFNGSRKSVDKISGTFKDLMNKINSGSPSKGGAASSSSFDYDQLNDQLEKASLPSPDLPSPGSGDSASGGFTNHPSFENHQESEANDVLEGFVCPLCLISFSSPGRFVIIYKSPLTSFLQPLSKNITRSITRSSCRSRRLNS